MFLKICLLGCEMYFDLKIGTCCLDPEDILYPEDEGSRFFTSIKLHGIITQ
jgi:hypothetical protein